MFLTNLYFESLTECYLLLLPTWLRSPAWANWCWGSVKHHSIKLRDTNQAAVFNQLASWTNTEQHTVTTFHTLSQATWSCHAYNSMVSTINVAGLITVKEWTSVLLTRNKYTNILFISFHYEGIKHEKYCAPTEGNIRATKYDTT